MEKKREKIVIFTGAGIGKILGLPSAADFVHLVDSAPSIVRHQLNQLGNNRGDIEKVLDLIAVLASENSPFVYFLENPSRVAYPDALKDLQDFRNKALPFAEGLKRSLFTSLEQFNSKDAADLYSNILEELIECHGNPIISIITTNYDMSFENGWENYRNTFMNLGYHTNYHDGFVNRGNYMVFKKDGSFDNLTDEGYEYSLEYLKIHGSLNWTYRGADIVQGGVHVPYNPDSLPILYPGYKGKPTKEPFATLHSRFRNKMKEATKVYVVGFAFRDPEINQIFQNAMQDNINLKVFCYNPLPLEEHPSESLIRDFVNLFPSRFEYFQQKVENVKRPLGLKLLQSVDESQVI